MATCPMTTSRAPVALWCFDSDVRIHTPVVRLAFHCDLSNEDDTRFVLVDFCDFDRLYRPNFFFNFLYTKLMDKVESKVTYKT